MNGIEELLGSLSAEDMESLRETARSLLGGAEGKGDGRAEKKEDEGDISGMLTPEMLRKLSGMMSMLKKKDSRSDLICALKPMLGSKRKRRADEAMQLLRLMELMPMLGKMTEEKK